MNTTTIELACLGLAFGNETAAFNRQRTTYSRPACSAGNPPAFLPRTDKAAVNRQRTTYSRPACSAGNLPAFLPRTDKAAVNRQRATDKTWGQLLREEGFLRS